jgi:hypothetical protein
MREPIPASRRPTDRTDDAVSDQVLDGPHGPLRVRVYTPESPAGPGLVWVHGGGFLAGEIDMPEADWVARSFADRGIAVVSVDYALAPFPLAWAAASEAPEREGVHYPVASDEVEAAFRWAVDSDLASLQEAPPKRVGDTPRSLTTLNRGSGSTNWVGFCGKRHVRLKPSNVERGLVRLTLAGRPLRTLGVLTAAAHSVPPGHLLPSLRARRSSSAPE